MAAPNNQQHSGIDRISVRLLDVMDSFFYALVGIAFLAAAAVTLVYSVINAFNAISSVVLGNSGPNGGGVAQAVLDFVSDLLLVLIILEVLGTVRSYLDKRANSVQPFLFIGIISATRGILSIGARLSIAAAANGTNTGLQGDDFRNAMIELGINAFVIIALGVTLRIMGRYATGDAQNPESTAA